MRLFLAFVITLASALAQTTNYPSQLDTDANLYVAGENVTTQLLAAMGIGDSVAVVKSGTGWAVNMIATVDTEQMLVTAVTGNVLTVTRGYAGTAAAAHAANKVFANLTNAAYHNSIRSAVKAIETTLGPNLSNVSSLVDVRTSTRYNFSPQQPGVSLSVGYNNVAMTPCPEGVNGTNTDHYLRISGGTGTAETVLIAGGTCTSGAATGTVRFAAANTHSGSWQISSATAGIQEAIWANSGGTVIVPAGTSTLYSRVTVRSNTTVQGAGAGATIFRLSGYNNTADEFTHCYGSACSLAGGLSVFITPEAGASNVKLANFTIDEQSVVTTIFSTQIALYACTDCLIDSVSVVNAAAGGPPIDILGQTTSIRSAIRNSTVVGTNSGPCSGAFFVQGKSITVEHNRSYGACDEPFVANHADSKDIVFRDNICSGSAAKPSCFHAEGASHVTFDSNTVEGSAIWGFVVGEGSTYISILNNRISEVGQGISIYGGVTELPFSDISIIGNEVYGTSQTPIMVNPAAGGKRVLISKNVIHDGGTDGSDNWAGIWIHSYAYGGMGTPGTLENLTITDNLIYDNGDLGQLNTGIAFTPISTEAVANDVIITGNQIFNTTSGASRVQAVGIRSSCSGCAANTLKRWTIKDNVIRNHSFGNLFFEGYARELYQTSVFGPNVTDSSEAGVVFKPIAENYTSNGTLAYTQMVALSGVPSGASVFCSDCAAASPCAGSGSGQLASYDGSNWNCSASIAPNSVNWLTQISNKPFLDTRAYNWSQVLSTTLTGGTPATITITCPVGVPTAALSGKYFIYISGGSGTAEGTKATGGTCNGSGTGTIVFTPRYSHSGSLTFGSASAGIQEAIWDGYTNGPGIVQMPAGLITLHAPIYIAKPSAAAPILQGHGKFNTVLQPDIDPNAPNATLWVATSYLYSKVNTPYETGVAGLFVIEGNDKAPTFKDFNVRIAQPSFGGMTIADIIRFPTIFYARGTSELQIKDVMIEQAWIGIDVNGIYSAGWTHASGRMNFENLDMGAYFRGIQGDGVLDSMRVHSLHYWVFPGSMSADQTKVWYGTTSVGGLGPAAALYLGSAFDVNVSDSLFINAISFYTSVGADANTPNLKCTNCQFDSEASIVQEGGYVAISNSTFSSAANDPALDQFCHNSSVKAIAGILRISNSVFTDYGCTKPIIDAPVTSAAITLTGNQFFRYTSTGTYPADTEPEVKVARASGTDSSDLTLTGNRFSRDGSKSWTNAVVSVDSHTTLNAHSNLMTPISSGSGKLFSVTGDGYHNIAGNTFAGWTTTYPTVKANGYYQHPIYGIMHVEKTKPVSVIDFGADPTGTLSSSTAIQAAIDWLGPLGGGTIYFPRGEYKATATTSSTYSNMTFQGERGQSVIKLSASSGSLIALELSGSTSTTTKVASDVNGGFSGRATNVANSITVASATGIAAGAWLQLIYNESATRYFAQVAQVKSVVGTTVTLDQAVRIPMASAQSDTVVVLQPIANVHVKDLVFDGSGLSSTANGIGLARYYAIHSSTENVIFQSFPNLGFGASANAAYYAYVGFGNRDSNLTAINAGNHNGDLWFNQETDLTVSNIQSENHGNADASGPTFQATVGVQASQIMSRGHTARCMRVTGSAWFQLNNVRAENCSQDGVFITWNSYQGQLRNLFVSLDDNNSGLVIGGDDEQYILVDGVTGYGNPTALIYLAAIATEHDIYVRNVLPVGTAVAPNAVTVDSSKSAVSFAQGSQQDFQFGCTGVATSSTTLYVQTLPPAACTATTQDQTTKLTVTSAGTLTGLFVHASAGGSSASSGVVTVMKNGSATSITCTVGTGTACSDTTHSVLVGAGDQVAIRYTTQGTETLANLTFAVSKQ